MQRTDLFSGEIGIEHCARVDRIELARNSETGDWRLQMFAGESELEPLSAPAGDLDTLRLLLDVPRRIILNQEQHR